MGWERRPARPAWAPAVEALESNWPQPETLLPVSAMTRVVIRCFEVLGSVPDFAIVLTGRKGCGAQARFGGSERPELWFDEYSRKPLVLAHEVAHVVAAENGDDEHGPLWQGIYVDLVRGMWPRFDVADALAKALDGDA